VIGIAGGDAGFGILAGGVARLGLGARITLPAIQHLSVSSGNDNQLKIGEKSPKPIGKET
jgi:hypothetical protein